VKRGAALPMVLLSLGLVAALSVGGAFVTRRYAADGRLRERSADLEPALEQALVSAAIQSDTAALRAMPMGGSSQSRGPELPNSPGLVTAVWVTRLTQSTFMFVAEGTSMSKPLWRKRLGIYVVLDTAGLMPLSGRPWVQLP
jgi:hypothetical protein